MDAAQFVRYFSSDASGSQSQAPPPPVLTIPGFVHPVKEVYLEELDVLLLDPTALSVQATPDEDEDYEDEGDEGIHDGVDLDLIGDDSDSDNEANIAGQKQAVPRPPASSSASSEIFPMSSTGVKPRVINYEQKHGGARLFPLVAKAVMYADKVGSEDGDDGAVLVFMSGVGEVSRALTAIEQLANRLGRLHGLLLLPLHGSLSPADQQKVFQRPPRGVRKIVVCTNVAETSITIDDCAFVIDSGRMKEMQYEAEGRLSSLVERDVSAASARQRRGRAGRVRPGRCFRLYTRSKHASLPAHQSPEIHRVPLERLCLLVRFLGLGRPKAFLMQLLDPPAEAAITAALQHLRALGAMDEKNSLTPLGQHLAGMPVDAQVGKLLVYGALLRCPEQMLTIAAGLSGRSPFTRDPAADATKRRLSGRHMSDHLALLGAVQEWRRRRREGGAGATRALCAELGLHAEGLKQLWETRVQVSCGATAADCFSLCVTESVHLDIALQYDRLIT